MTNLDYIYTNYSGETVTLAKIPGQIGVQMFPDGVAFQIPEQVTSLSSLVAFRKAGQEVAIERAQTRVIERHPYNDIMSGVKLQTDDHMAHMPSAAS